MIWYTAGQAKHTCFLRHSAATRVRNRCLKMAESQLPIVIVTPEDDVEPPHKVDHICGSPGGRHLAAYSLKHASVWLLSEKSRCEIELFESPGEFNLSVDLTGNLLAYTYSDSLLRIRHVNSSAEQIFDDCPKLFATRFDEQGRLWTVRQDDELIVELRAADDWQVIGQRRVNDQGGGADLGPSPSQNAMIVSPYSGQSEQENFFCEFEDVKIRTHQLKKDRRRTICFRLSRKRDPSFS